METDGPSRRVSKAGLDSGKNRSFAVSLGANPRATFSQMRDLLLNSPLGLPEPSSPGEWDSGC